MTSAGPRAGREDERRSDMLAALEYGVHPMVRETRPVRETYLCDLCPAEFTHRGPLANHYRWQHP